MGELGVMPLLELQDRKNTNLLEEEALVAPVSIHPNHLNCYVMIGIELTKEL